MPDRPPVPYLGSRLRFPHIAVPLVLLCSGFAHAADIHEVLARMEPGSVIKDLLIPRYDKEKKASLVLRADQLVVESLSLLTAENLSLHLITSESSAALKQSRFAVASCRYDLDTAMLRSESSVTAISANFYLQSHGLITRIEKGQTHISAFLLPPAHGFFNTDSNDTSAMNRTRQSLLLASFLASAAAQDAPAPAPQDAFFSLSPRSQEVDARLQEFAKTNKVAIAPVPLPVAPDATLPPVAAVAAMPKFVPAADALGFACKGGIFYDSKSASMTLLRVVTVRNPAYAMTVQGEVKVFFEPEKPKEDKTATNDKKNEPAQKKEPSEENALGKVKQMVGTGGVAFEAIDKDGVKNFASGESVVYEVATEEIHLKGQKLVFQQGTQSRFESAAPGAWLRFNKKTKNFTMSDGWNARLTMPAQDDTKKKTPQPPTP
jgi:lipopolysaccharide export system protein LptA